MFTLVDDYSKYVSVYLLQSKAQVLSKFLDYKNMMENLSDARIMRIRSDNGSEFKNKRMAAACRNYGIVHQKTIPYSPQQNGVAERMNRTLIEKARCMMHYRAVPTKWWAEAVSTASYLINRKNTSANSHTTPYEIGVKPNLEHLRIFGSMGFAHIDESKRKKLDAKSFKCRLLGYADDAKGYKVLNMESNKVEVSRSVKLDEREVGGVYDNNELDDVGDSHDHQFETNDDEYENNVMTAPGPEPESTDYEMNEPMEDYDEPVTTNATSIVPMPAVRSPSVQPVPPPLTDAMVFHPGPNRRVSNRVQPPTALTHDVKSYQRALENGPSNQREPLQLDNRPHNPEFRLSGSNSERPSKRHRHDDDDEGFEIALAVHDAPATYKEAVSSSEKNEWSKAIRAEFKAHERNGTWTKVKRRAGMKLLKTKWVFAKKFNELGELLRLKARLVALGFLQKYGVDFFETYAAVANMSSIRMFLSSCTALGLVIEQLGVDTAYLNADLEEDVYIEFPEGLEGNSEYVLKLNKALYGLKQAGNAWFKTINRLLLKLGFKPCGGDTCMYTKRVGNDMVYICLYVDDMVVSARTIELVNEVKSSIASQFRIKELGPVKHLLGMEVNYNQKQRTMTITQTQYIKTMAKRFNQQNARSTTNPCDPSLKLSKADSPTDEEKEAMTRKPFRSLIGSLQYVAQCTRPDIAYAVTHLSRFMENAGSKHWNAAIKILRYLSTTPIVESTTRPSMSPMSLLPTVMPIGETTWRTVVLK